MKKVNLLSKIQMKKVMGGYLSLTGCKDDTQCTGGQWCCPDMRDPHNHGLARHLNFKLCLLVMNKY